MVIVKLMGGLGNQMFQYAAGRRLAEIHQTPLRMDLSFLLDRRPHEGFVHRDFDLDIFNIREEFATPKQVARFTGRHARAGQRWLHKVQKKLGVAPAYLLETRPYELDPRLLEAPGDCYLDGFWQNPRYFQDIEPLVRQEFTFRAAPADAATELLERIRAVNAVCLNVRRGDYVSIPSTNRHHGVCEADYFLRGAKLIADRVPEPHFFAFSDDVEWCRAELRLPYPTTIVTEDFAGAKFADKLRLMINCRHFIIPNSTFGWWGAWLCTHADKFVVVPERWLNDTTWDTRGLIPAGWLQV